MTKPKFGPTGEFPYGSVGADDDGELTAGIVADHANGIVRIAFGTPVAWIGLPAIAARDLAARLIEKADELDKHKS